MEYHHNSQSSEYVFYVVCMSSGDLLIWRNFKFWSKNICYCWTFSWEKESLIGQQFFVGPIRDWFSQFKNKQIFVLQNLKFRQISKSPDDIYTTLKSILNVKSWMKASNFYYFSFQNIIVFNNVKFWNTLFSKMMLSFWPPLLKVNKMPRTFLWPFS